MSLHHPPLHLQEWDKGLFSLELVRQSLFPRKISSDTQGAAGALIGPPTVPKSLNGGTFSGTAKAATEMFDRIEQRFGSFFDIANYEASVPQDISLDEKKKLYTWQVPGSDNYPPHLALIPAEDKVGLLKIFDAMRLLDTGVLLIRIIPEKILDFIYSDPNGDGSSIAEIEERNKRLRSQKKDIYKEPNIGDRDDWYTDAIFGQTQFTGANPTTIKTAPSTWVDQFKTAAKAQKNDKMSALLTSASPDSLYIQDYSYFREAVGAPADATMKSADGTRFASASVSLFQLSASGKLHPLAIILDYKGSLDKSVVVFNKRLYPSDPTDTERTDWPWRYAKLCSQASDYVRHELTVHLTDTHLVEEATIVAAHRAFEVEHIVYRLLQPHWLKTLSLNAAARAALVPAIIVPNTGITEDQVYKFIQDGYERFNWTASYVPNDLKARGFPDVTNDKYHNYGYGKNILIIWQILRKFVASVIATVYTTDDQVAKDKQVSDWCTEMRGEKGGQMPSFPVIKTRDELIDAVTMCIHIAAPQHTAVNYLQEYFLSFVINKPPALCSPLPTSLAAVQAYKESDLLKALPVNRPREWLLASHLPSLLSKRVAEDQNLPNFAVSLAKLAAQKGETKIADAAITLYKDLVDLSDVFKHNSKGMDYQIYGYSEEYNVIDPQATAVSILI